MTRRLLITCMAALLLTACGGGSDDGSSKERAKPKADPRAGYFQEEELEALEPAMESYNETSLRYYEEGEACNKEADRLFKAGKTPRQSVECHLRLTKGLNTSVAEVRTAMDDIEGDHRAECDAAVKEFTEFLPRYEGALKAIQADWLAYANGKPTPQINAHSKAVDDHAKTFSTTAFGGVAKSCYTKADRTKLGTVLEADA